MQKLLCCVILSACAAVPSIAAAGELKLSIANGRATLIATDVPIRQVLSEWARIGETKVVNGDRLIGPNLTLQLIDRPEREVLDAVLRTAAGYVAAPRSASASNLSMYDRILILPTSQAPAYNPGSMPTPTFTPPQRPMPVPMPDNDDPVEQPNVLPPGAVVLPGAVPQGQQQQTQPAPGMPQTLPRPGMLPQPPPGMPNPYNPTQQQPIVRPPGTPGAPVPGGVKPPGGGGEPGGSGGE